MLFFFISLVCSQMASPGAWLSDLCQERYEVREKKTSKKVLTCSFISFHVLFVSYWSLYQIVCLLRKIQKKVK